MMGPFLGGMRGPAANVGGKELPVTRSSEPVVGYRTWRILHDEFGLALMSLHIPYTWKVDNEAKCHPDGFTSARHESPSPELSCACGIYCQLPDHPLEEWDHMVKGRVRATGTVALSGRVIRCQRGFKGQYATIQSPVVVEVNCSYLHGTCNEPVVTLALPDGNVRDVYGHCAEHRLALTDDLPPLVDAAIWMREACRILEARYPGVEMLNWMEV